MASSRTLELRLVVLAPPGNVEFALQTRKRELEQSVRSTGEDLTFHCSVQIVTGSGGVDFKGRHVNGPRGGRFLYINSGGMAGQTDTCWSRRAKIHLMPIKPLLPEASDDAVLEARMAGTGRDGGPLCASIPVEWRMRAP